MFRFVPASKESDPPAVLMVLAALAKVIATEPVEKAALVPAPV